MTLGHAKLDVERLSIGYVAWVFEKAEVLPDRMAAMLSRLGGRGYEVQENHATYGETDASDPDSDFDLVEHDNEPQTMRSRRRVTACLNATLGSDASSQLRGESQQVVAEAGGRSDDPAEGGPGFRGRYPAAGAGRRGDGRVASLNAPLRGGSPRASRRIRG